MKKGDKVKVKAIVKGQRIYKPHQYGKHIREIKRYKKELTGIVLGFSFIKTGKIHSNRYYDDQNILHVAKSHKVIVVEPIEQNNTWLNDDKPLFETNRYLKPVRCLEEDLELIKCKN